MRTVINLKENKKLIIINNQIPLYQIMIINILITYVQLLKYVFIYKRLVSKLIIKLLINKKKLSKEKIKKINNYFNIIIYYKL